jgi:1,4-dihydroxy-2-naphthoate octaprenyltransferase
LLTTIGLQILSNLANDYGDGVKGTDNEQRIGPERAVQSGAITPKEMLNAIRVNILIVILLIFFLILSAFGVQKFHFSLLFFFLGVVSIYAAIKYTVGDTAYGYRALGDIMVFLFFGCLSVMGSYFLYARQLDHILILPAFSIGLLSTGVLNLNNMRDIDSDRESNKITLALKMGYKKAKIYHVSLVIIAIIMGVLFGALYYRQPLNFIFAFAFIPLVIHVMKVIKTKDPKDLDPQLKVLAFSTFFFSLLLGIGYIYNFV